MLRRRKTQVLLAAAREARYVGYWKAEACLVNLAGCYDYLDLPYYVSQDLEGAATAIWPTCKEMLDAYVPPLFLEKARLADVPVPKYYVSNGYYEPPLIIDPVNPFTLKGRIVLKPGREEATARSLTRNFTYAICCQELPAGCRIAHFRSVLGWSTAAPYRSPARVVWEVFHIPIARVRIVKCTDGSSLLSDISPLPFEELGVREADYVEEHIEWDKSAFMSSAIPSQTLAK